MSAASTSNRPRTVEDLIALESDFRFDIVDGEFVEVFGLWSVAYFIPDESTGEVAKLNLHQFRCRKLNFVSLFTHHPFRVLY